MLNHHAELYTEFGQMRVADVIYGQRDQVGEQVGSPVDTDARKIGVQILTVRLKRVDFPDKIKTSAYDRLQSKHLPWPAR